MKLTDNFSSEEFTCKCGCGYDDIDLGLVNHLQDARVHFGKKIKINSGCRCLEHNRKQGSKDTSQHVKGRAADIVVEDTAPEVVADYFCNKKDLFGGVGRYSTFTHVDTRGYNARWGKN